MILIALGTFAALALDFLFGTWAYIEIVRMWVR